MTDEKIKNSRELEFAVFCIENVAAKLGVDAEHVYQAFTEKSNILNGYIVPEYEVLHTQSREYIVNDLLDVMKERGVEKSLLQESCQWGKLWSERTACTIWLFSSSCFCFSSSRILACHSAAFSRAFSSSLSSLSILFMQGLLSSGSQTPEGIEMCLPVA